jgi:hypothetical protein
MSKTCTSSKTTSSIVKSTQAQARAAAHPVLTSSLGLIVGVIDSASCWVTFPDNPSTQAQRALVLRHVGEVMPGQSVLLQFASGDATQPFVAGILPALDPAAVLSTLAPNALAAPVTLDINGETLTLAAQQRITLRCGQSSLVMNADGTIEIRGTELLSRASGQNAIRGASISLN